MKKWLIGCSIPILIIIGLVVAFFAWLINMSSYYVEAYKPESSVISKNQDELHHRFTTFEYEDANIHLEWYTYDNQKINVAPYKLFVVVEPKSEELKKVNITSISISSSLGEIYEFSPSTQWPTVLNVTNVDRRVSHTFEPGFMFKFEEKEEISTQVEFEIKTKDKVRKETIDIKWVPIRVKHAAPIVKNSEPEVGLYGENAC
ncbi:hypothetical protein EGM51_09965 [Verrucomicrobia bacterium S94]|nr:hypothetical protein EGM51_09965 [Verrucomicrobia bacterium S94]